MKLLAVQARNRVPGLDLPTVGELGFPGLDFEGLVGMIAARSSNLPDAARDRIGSDIKAVSRIRRWRSASQRPPSSTRRATRPSSPSRSKSR